MIKLYFLFKRQENGALFFVTNCFFFSLIFSLYFYFCFFFSFLFSTLFYNALFFSTYSYIFLEKKIHPLSFFTRFLPLPLFLYSCFFYSLFFSLIFIVSLTSFFFFFSQDPNKTLFSVKSFDIPEGTCLF